MLSNLPFDGDYPIVQQFGDSPRTFRNVRCGGVPLRGHHGIDFGMPAGDPVFAVAGGTVVVSQDDPTGFGRHVLLEHHWGQTLYAHLSRLGVRAGDEVVAGDLVGRSGSTGLCLDPHLHFGLRINPYSLDDAWCGYTDPMPYLHRIVFGRGPLTGPHIIAGVPHHLELLKRWQPRLITVLEPNPDEIRRLRRVCPHSVVVGRIFEPEHKLTERIRSGPRAAARWAHERTLPYLSPDVDYYQFANEILQDAGDLALLNEFELHRMELAQEAGFACALFGFSVGNPHLVTHDHLAHWRTLYPAMERAEARGHIVVLHQYGVPNLWGPRKLYDWYIYRLEHQILRRLPFKRLLFALTETGIDGLIVGDEPSGWRNYMESADYTRQLQKSAAYTERYSGRVLGSTVFTLGHFVPWHSYDIKGDVSESLAAASDRGTWTQVNTAVTDIIPGSFITSDSPGVEALPDKDLDRTDPSPDPPDPRVRGDGKPSFSRRLDARFDRYHMEIKPVSSRPSPPGALRAREWDSAGIVYVVKDIFMTFDGSWEIEGKPGDVPTWARNDYLVPQFSEAGADHHLFGAIIDLDGSLRRDSYITYWSDGYKRIHDPDYGGFLNIRVKPESGWAHMPMASSSSFDPDMGDSGPWCWMPDPRVGGDSAAEVVCGGGLPFNRHVSTFVVWQAMRREDWEKLKHRSGVGKLPYPGLSHPVNRRISFCAPHFRLSIQRVTMPPLPGQESIAYAVRDLFTVYPDDEQVNPGLGACPSWAETDYLLPKLDEGGAAQPARIFAAVREEEGVLLPGVEVAFARGIDALRRDTDRNRIVRPTQIATGWAQLDLSREDIYYPSRVQAGSWCWAPAGAAEAVCGAGLPDGKRLFVFAVWERVK